MSANIATAIVVLNVPDSVASDEGVACARALVFAQLACRIGFPKVDRVERDGASWRIRIVETAAIATAK